MAKHLLARLLRPNIVSGLARWASTGASGARVGSGAFSDRMRLGFGVVSAGLAGGLILGATSQPAHLEQDQKNKFQEAVTSSYESRVRAFSSPEKVFQMFASVSKNGEAQMTAEDFVRSLSAMRSRQDDPKSPLKLSAAGKRLFQLVDANGDGVVSFHEYVFFMTLISIPESKLRHCFNMFDTDEGGSLDAAEFTNMMAVLKAKSAIGQAARGDVVASSNKAKRKKLKDADKAKDEYPILFGKNGNRSLTFKSFNTYLQALRQDLLTLEFDSLSPDRNETVDAKDFAYGLVCHSYPKSMQGYLKRIETLEPARISRKEYFNFASMLHAIDDIQDAIETFSTAKGEFTKEHLLHAAKAVAGVKLEPKTVDIVFHVFDDDRGGTLNHQEFTAVMKLRRDHGSGRKRQIDVTAFGKCCKACWDENIMFA